jgi:hypothetical protein
MIQNKAIMPLKQGWEALSYVAYLGRHTPFRVGNAEGTVKWKPMITYAGWSNNLIMCSGWAAAIVLK